MKIKINTDNAAEEIEISITCRSLTPDIEKIIAMLRMMDLKLTGTRDGETWLLDAAEVLYIDTADKKTFFYTQSDVYETSLHLYELEEQLSECGFLRIGKSCIVNLKHIVSLKAEFDRKIGVTLSNGERLVISRQYAESFKKKLGVK